MIRQSFSFRVSRARMKIRAPPDSWVVLSFQFYFQLIPGGLWKHDRNAVIERSHNDMLFGRPAYWMFCAVFESKKMRALTIWSPCPGSMIACFWSQINAAGRANLSSPSLWVLFARTVLVTRLRPAQRHQVAPPLCAQTSRPRHWKSVAIVSWKVSARQYDSWDLLSKVRVCTWLLLDLVPSTFIHPFPTEKLWFSFQRRRDCRRCVKPHKRWEQSVT